MVYQINFKERAFYQMTFYSIDFLKSQSSWNDYLKYAFIFGLLIILIIVFIFYIKNKLQTKYRDLSLIILLTIIFILGIQYSQYIQNQNQHSGTAQMINVIKQVAENEHKNSQDILVNSTYLTDGVLMKINKQYYKINLSPDSNSYVTQKIYLLNPDITIQR